MTRIAAAALAVALASCGDGAPPDRGAPVPDPPDDAIAIDQDAPPARLAIRLWPAQPTLGDSIWLRIDVDAPPEVAVSIPFDDAAVGRFAILRHVPEARRATYELSAPMSGRHRIPPLRVTIDGADVFTEEIPIAVGAIAAARTDQAMVPARGALPVRVGGGIWWPAVAIGTLGAAALAGGFVVVALRRGAVRRRQVSAWEAAIRALADLEHATPADPDALDAWFVALSAVIRAYVERRFGLRAPELTTEEFLAVAQRTPDLSAGHRELLGSFLARCDEVKFAGWRPAPTESREVLASARSFVSDTRPLAEGTP
jgi:hypothetical protein